MEPVSTKVKFAVVPTGIITATHAGEVSHQALSLYATIACYVDFEDRSGWPGMERLAVEMGVSEATLKRWMKELVDAGWAHRKRRRGTSSLTHLCLWKGEPPPWVETAHQRAERPVETAHPRAEGTAHQRAEPIGNENQGTKPRTPREPRWSEAARAIAKTVYDQLAAAGRPQLSTRGFQGYAEVAQKLLDAGHTSEVIVEAIPRARACTADSVTFEINRRSKPTGVADPDPHVLDHVFGRTEGP